MANAEQTDQPTTTGTATSRLSQGRRGVRKATRARLALSGPSGSGKTWTGLGLAVLLADGGPILCVDTEPGDGRQGAAELYALHFRFDTIQWDPPYDPRDLALTIREAGSRVVPDTYWPQWPGGYAVILVDSASHFWRGEGGTLDIADGRFGGWKVATPVQDDMVEAIMRSPAHLIVCTRAKQAYEVSESTDANGNRRQSVAKLGLAPIQRDDLEYEFQVVAMMDTAHRIDIGKTRAETLAGKSYLANTQEQFGLDYRAWLELGLQVAPTYDVDAIRWYVRALEPAKRKVVAPAFRARFGDPDHLLAEQVADAWTFLALATQEPVHPYQPSPNGPWCVTCATMAHAPWHHSAGPPSSVDAEGSSDDETGPKVGGEDLPADDTPPGAAGPEAPAGDATATPEAPVTPSEAPVATPPAPAPTVPSEADVAVITEAVAAMERSEVVALLDARSASTAGNVHVQRMRLRQVLAGEGWQPPGPVGPAVEDPEMHPGDRVCMAVATDANPCGRRLAWGIAAIDDDGTEHHTFMHVDRDLLEDHEPVVGTLWGDHIEDAGMAGTDTPVAADSEAALSQEGR